ncbi:MAG: glycosyltransferase family 4 protein [Herpetosiphonaceae bacterium]|nr:glycosyltransferase family 4 protein [Herpetosiphonaceae bacterium]
MHVVVPTDVFPPGKVGGAAWSTLALCQALRQRGHRVTVILPRRGATGIQERSVEGLPVIEVGYQAPAVPFVQNYWRYERLWPRLVRVIAEVARAQGEFAGRTIIHGQHAQTGPAAVLAGQLLGVPSVVTVRDHWPWDYFATGLHGNRVPYARNTVASLVTDLPAREGALRGVLALPAVPYMLRHVQRRGQLLAQANAVIAVSHYLARRLGERLPAASVHVIPNLVDLPAIKATVAHTPGELPDEPFVLFVGKLEHNKGAHLLPAMMCDLPSAPLLLIAGDGGLRSELEATLSGAGVRFRILPGWTEHDAVLQLMARATVQLFPSAWGEPLSRVLLEACAAGACLLALDTGGTADVVVDERSGVLVHSVVAMRRELRALLIDQERRERLRSGAQMQAHVRFSAPVVVEHVEVLYRSLTRSK